MNRKRRNVRRTLFWSVTLLALAMALLIRLRVYPVIRQVARNGVVNEAARAINQSVDEQIAEGRLNYDTLVTLEKNQTGGVTAIQTNMAEMNRLKSEILTAVDSRILALNVTDIGVPLGSVILPDLFAGQGPILPVRVMSITASDASFVSRFTEAGINQTLHRILLTVAVNMTVLTPTGLEQMRAESQVVAAETVIVGSVPGTYLNMDRH